MGNLPFFFCHIPKTAGSTFVDILENFFPQNEICPAYYTYELNNFAPSQIQNFRLFRGHIDYHVLGQFLPERPQTLTFIRNPFDHAISIFSHLKRKTDQEFIENEIQAIRQMSLEKFVYQPHDIINLNYANLQLRTLTANLYSERLPSGDGQIIEVTQASPDELKLEYARQLLCDFVFVGLPERFEDSIFLLSYLFNKRPLDIIPYVNVSYNKPDQNQIRPDFYDEIARTSALDIKLYNHAQEIFEERFARMTEDLLSRYGNTRQAHLRIPIPREELYELLEKHYQAEFVRRHPAVTSLTYGFEQPLDGRQWHKREINPDHGLYRWSGPKTTATVDLPLAAECDLEISFEVIMVLSPEVLDSVGLDVAGTPIALSSSTTETGSRVYRGVIPQAVLEEGQGLARLNFSIDHTVAVSSIDPTTDDTRKLGLAVTKIETTPKS